jgi:hypothetical protein
MISPPVLNGMYVIVGASGNTGSIIPNSLLLKTSRRMFLRLRIKTPPQQNKGQ